MSQEMMAGYLQSMAGYELYANPLLTVSKEVHRRERKWAHRVMYQRDRRFIIRVEQVPSSEVIQIGARLFMHPQTLARVKQALDAQGVK